MSTTSEQTGKQTKIYLTVIGIVLTFVLISAAISFTSIPTGTRIAIALAIAIFQVTLSAAYFMHLNAEKTLIYGVLLLTAVFFAFLLFLPILTHSDHTGTRLDSTSTSLPTAHHVDEGHAK